MSAGRLDHAPRWAAALEKMLGGLRRGCAGGEVRELAFARRARCRLAVTTLLVFGRGPVCSRLLRSCRGPLGLLAAGS